MSLIIPQGHLWLGNKLLSNTQQSAKKGAESVS